MSFVKKILKDPKEFQVFPHSSEKRTKGKGFFWYPLCPTIFCTRQGSTSRGKEKEEKKTAVRTNVATCVNICRACGKRWPGTLSSHATFLTRRRSINNTDGAAI